MYEEINTKSRVCACVYVREMQRGHVFAPENTPNNGAKLISTLFACCAVLAKKRVIYNCIIFACAHANELRLTMNKPSDVYICAL